MVHSLINNESGRNKIILTGILLLFHVFFSSLIVSGQQLAVGKVIDTVKCIKKSDQTYSLYLPSKYNEKVKWPVIVVFDPGARGRTATEIFRQAGERYGYIIVCSNNSRNGPLNLNFIAAQSVLSDITTRFAINEKMIFVSGFSGGSRFALALASTEKRISGVIGCGAGLPNDKTLYPTINSSFLYYGIAGTRDMNYLEMFELMDFFSTKTQVTPYLRTFEGGHQWPSPEVITEAVEWLNLKMMNKNILAADSTFKRSYFIKVSTMINALGTSGNQLDAGRYSGYAVRDFSGTKYAAEMKKLLTAAYESKEYKGLSREWNNIASLERSKSEKYVNSLERILNSGTVADSVSAWWKNEIESLRVQRDNSSPQKSRMASRLLNFVSILCSGQAGSLYQNRYFELAAFLYYICTLSDSENMNNYYNHARALASLNRKREAIDALSKASEHGYSSLKAVNSDPAFNTLRNDEKFKSIIAKFK